MPAPVRKARPEIDLGGLPWQRIGHVERPLRRIRNAVAAAAETIDLQALNHGLR